MNANKKLLLTFDLNCLLGYVQHKKFFNIENLLSLEKKPKIVDGDMNVFYRPSLDELLFKMFDNLKDRYEIAVWSSQDKEQTNKQIQYFFGQYRFNLKFCLFTKNENNTPINEQNRLLPSPTKKDLNIIFEKYPEFNLCNTLIISNHSNLIKEYQRNDVVLPIYRPYNAETNFIADGYLHFLIEYLFMINGLNSNSKLIDVRETMQQLTFDYLVKLRVGSHRPNQIKWDESNIVRF